MTYLQAVNAVLRRLREQEVSTISSDSYSALIGDIVNDANRQVEDAWQWNALRTTLAIATVDGTQEYALTDWGQRALIESITNDTRGVFLQERSPVWLQREGFNNTSKGSPSYFVVDGVDASGDINIKLHPTPDAAYNLTASAWVGSADMTSDTDTLSVPSAPVVHLAVAIAARERGEVGGQTAIELLAIAQRSLSDAIARDSMSNQALTDWAQV